MMLFSFVVVIICDIHGEIGKTTSRNNVVLEHRGNKLDRAGEDEADPGLSVL